MYADDTQLYLAFNPNTVSGITDATEALQKCLSDIKKWMMANKLKLNESKTEILVISTHTQLKKNLLSCVSFAGESIYPASQARNLGVVFNSVLNFDSHVSSICKSANYYIRSIHKVRKYMDKSTTDALVRSLVTSRIDYCNSLLGGVQNFVMQRLQRIQNASARLICRIPRSEHITPTLKGLHWLPIKQRIMYKQILLTYKILHGLSPGYLADVLHPYAPSRILRSSQKQFLCIPQTRLKTFGDRVFSVQAPKLWNSLPLELKLQPSVQLFKKHLKTHLFTSAYEYV